MSSIRRRTGPITDRRTIRERLARAVNLICEERSTPDQARAVLEERARALARVPVQPPSTSLALDVVTFSLANEDYAIELGYVHKIVPLIELGDWQEINYLDHARGDTNPTRQRGDRRRHALASASVPRWRVGLVWPVFSVPVSMRSLETDRSLGDFRAAGRLDTGSRSARLPRRRHQPPRRDPPHCRPSQALRDGSHRLDRPVLGDRPLRRARRIRPAGG